MIEVLVSCVCLLVCLSVRDENYRHIMNMSTFSVL